MSDVSTPDLRRALASALRDAYNAALGVPPLLEQRVREYARALRIDGVPVEKMLVDVKELVRSETKQHELVFMPRIVGWSVAGYYAGTSPKDAPERA